MGCFANLTSQPSRFFPLKSWIQSDLGALAMLARGAVAMPRPPVPLPPTDAPAHAAATAMVQVAATRPARLEREKKEVMSVAPTRAVGAGTDSSPRCWPASRPDT